MEDGREEIRKEAKSSMTSLILLSNVVTPYTARFRVVLGNK